MGVKPDHIKTATVIFWVPNSDNSKMKYLKVVLKEAVGCDVSPHILKMTPEDVVEFQENKLFYKASELVMQRYRTGHYLLHPFHSGFMEIDTVEKLAALTNLIEDCRGVSKHPKTNKKGSYYLVDIRVDKTALTKHPRGYDTLHSALEKLNIKNSQAPGKQSEEPAKKYLSVDEVLANILNTKPTHLHHLDAEFAELSSSELLDIHALITKHFHKAVLRDRARWNDAVISFVDYIDMSDKIHATAQGQFVNIMTTQNTGENHPPLFGDVLLERVSVNYYRMLTPTTPPVEKQDYSNTLEFIFNYPTRNIVVEMGIKENPLEGRTFERPSGSNNKPSPKRPTIHVSREISNDTQYMSNEWISLLENVLPAEFIEHVYYAFVRDSAYTS